MRHLPSITGLVALSLTAAAPPPPAEPADIFATPAQLDPIAQAFVDSLASRGGPPIYTLPVAEARAFLDTLQSGPTTPVPADIEDRDLPVGPTGSVGVRIVRPLGSKEMLPVIVYFHGGGWILGDEKTHDRLIRALATRSGAALAFVKYTPSPEAQFPVPLEQAYAATRFIAEHGADFNLDTSRLAVAGDSVGGNMATEVTRLAKARGGPEIAYQALFYPVTNVNFFDKSYQQFSQGPWLTTASMVWFFSAYAPKLADRLNPDVAPLLATVEQLADLPPALVITDENDVLRDEGEAYAHKLIRAGVPVTAVRYLGTMHDFMMLDALADTPAARSAVALAGDTLHDALFQTAPPPTSP
jgi:acetyl esterase